MVNIQRECEDYFSPRTDERNAKTLIYGENKGDVVLIKSSLC